MQKQDSPARRVAGPNQGMLLIALNSLVTLAIVSLVPNLPQLQTRFRSVPNSEYYVPMIITIPSLCIAFVSPLAGVAADFWGRRRLMLTALVVYSVVGVLPVLTNNLFSILATRVGVGVAEAAILTCVNALLGDYFAGDERRKWLSYTATLGTIIASGLMLAGGRLGAIDWHAPFFLYGVGLVLLLWALSALWEPQRTSADQVVSPSVRDARVPFPWGTTAVIGAVTIGVVLLYFVQAIQLGSMFAEHGVDSPARISNFTATASLGVLAGGFSYRYIGRLGLLYSLAITLGTMGLGYIGIAMAASARAALPFALLAQFANGLTLPTLINWALGKYDYSIRGRGMGIWGSCFFIATFLSPLLVTRLGSITGGFLNTVQVLGIAAVAAAAVLAVLVRGRRAQ